MRQEIIIGEWTFRRVGDKTDEGYEYEVYCEGEHYVNEFFKDLGEVFDWVYNVKNPRLTHYIIFKSMSHDRVSQHKRIQYANLNRVDLKFIKRLNDMFETSGYGDDFHIKAVEKIGGHSHLDLSKEYPTGDTQLPDSFYEE
jgi:hypothetical protein